MRIRGGQGHRSAPRSVLRCRGANCAKTWGGLSTFESPSTRVIRSSGRVSFGRESDRTDGRAAREEGEWGKRGGARTHSTQSRQALVGSRGRVPWARVIDRRGRLGELGGPVAADARVVEAVDAAARDMLPPRRLLGRVLAEPKHLGADDEAAARGALPVASGRRPDNVSKDGAETATALDCGNAAETGRKVAKGGRGERAEAERAFGRERVERRASGQPKSRRDGGARHCAAVDAVHAEEEKSRCRSLRPRVIGTGGQHGGPASPAQRTGDKETRNTHVLGVVDAKETPKRFVRLAKPKETGQRKAGNGDGRARWGAGRANEGQPCSALRVFS